MRGAAYDFDANDDAITLDMESYDDGDINKFIKKEPVGRGDVFVRLQQTSKPEELKGPAGSNCGALGCNISGSAAQIKAKSSVDDLDEPVVEDDYNDQDISKSIK